MQMARRFLRNFNRLRLAMALVSFPLFGGLGGCDCDELDRLEPVESGRIHGVVCDEEALAASDQACSGRDPRAGSLEGTICNRHVGEPVREASVIVVVAPDDSEDADDPQTFETNTDEGGAFVLEGLPAGEHVVTVRAPGFERSWPVEIQEGRRTTLDVGSDCRPRSPDVGLVRGVVCDDEGGLMQGADVTAFDTSGERYLDRTDAEGRFVLGPLVPGRVDIVVEKDRPSTPFRVELTAEAVAGEETWVASGSGCAPQVCELETFAPQAQEEGLLMLVVDRSGSMAQAAPSYGTTRWSALVEVIGSVASQLEQSVELGLMLYPDREVHSCTPGQVDVAPDYGRAAMLAAELEAFSSSPLGATPTAGTLAAARAYLAPRANGTEHLAVVLATDGGPNCNAALDPNTCACTFPDGDCSQVGDGSACLDHVDAVAEVAALAAIGIDTYVIGIPGAEDYGWVLDEMAEAGGTGASYDAHDVDALEDAFAQIGRQVSSCTLVLEHETADVHQVAVEIDGEPFVRDPLHLDGFDLTEDGTLTLYGDACQRWQDISLGHTRSGAPNDPDVDPPQVAVELCRLDLEGASTGAPWLQRRDGGLP